MSYLPAPYESAEQDDLAATIAAILTTTVALITSWVLGQHVYPVLRDLVDAALGDLSPAQQDALQASAPTVGIPTVGWTIAAVLMTIGALLLLFRRGRGLLIFGALVSVGTTAYAQFGLGYGGADAVHPVDQWGLFWGGVVVAALAMLPATGRWVGRTRRVAKSPAVIGTTESGAILWPGM